jgi:hypothetical protein
MHEELLLLIKIRKPKASGSTCPLLSQSPLETSKEPHMSQNHPEMPAVSIADTHDCLCR